MNAEPRSELQQIRSGAEVFKVSVIETKQAPRRAVLFAAGRGGDPLRHLPLLRSLASLGCTIVAPHFDLLTTLVPTKAELDTRLRRLREAADVYLKTDLTIVGIGHSIGTVTLLVLAGAEAHTSAGDQVICGRQLKFDRLALFAPPTDFFRRPGALKSVKVPIRIWVGARDSVTPPAQVLFLQAAFKSQAPVEIRLDDQAGHFSYMDELPPNVIDSQPDRGKSLAALIKDVGRFAMV